MSRTDLGKKIKEGVEEAAKSARTSAETVTKRGEKLGKSGAFRAISQVSHCHDCWLNTKPYIKSVHGWSLDCHCSFLHLRLSMI